MKSKNGYKNICSIGAALIWGFWAYTINNDNMQTSMKSGLFQAISSYLITYTSVEFLYYLQNQFNKKHSKVLLPPMISLVTCGIIYTFLHLWIKTENILPTIVPNLIAGVIFSLVTCLHLYKNSY